MNVSLARSQRTTDAWLRMEIAPRPIIDDQAPYRDASFGTFVWRSDEMTRAELKTLDEAFFLAQGVDLSPIVCYDGWYHPARYLLEDLRGGEVVRTFSQFREDIFLAPTFTPLSFDLRVRVRRVSLLTLEMGGNDFSYAVDYLWYGSLGEMSEKVLQRLRDEQSHLSARFLVTHAVVEFLRNRVWRYGWPLYS